MFSGLLSSSILSRALERRLFEVALVQIRDFAEDKHRRVDDASFGGGPGMVLKADVLNRALRSVVGGAVAGHVVYLSPQGKRFTQDDAKRLAGLPHVALVCGHYEGVDERFITHWVDEEISLGDFVLTGGEIPAMAVMDAVARLLPGVLGDETSVVEDSFYHGLLDYPHFTRPAMLACASLDGPSKGIMRQHAVPDVLRSGDHGAVDGWRRRQSLLRTLIRRPDMLGKARLTRAEKRLMEQLAQDLDVLEYVSEASEASEAVTKDR